MIPRQVKRKGRSVHLSLTDPTRHRSDVLNVKKMVLTVRSSMLLKIGTHNGNDLFHILLKVSNS